MNPRNCSSPLALFAARRPTRFGSRLATILAVIATLPVFGPGTTRAQEGTALEPRAQDRSVLSDPRLRNMLRTVKVESETAIGEIAKDPEEAVRNATRIFQEQKDKIDPENIEAVAAKIQSDGTVEKTVAAISQALPQTPDESPSAVSAIQVPATRPAPGISGGEPTPVAMPVNPEEIPVTETEKVDPSDLPSATSIVQENNISTVPGAPPTTPMIPDSPGLTPGEIPAPVPLTRKYEPGGGGGFSPAGENQMEILSKESVMDSARGVLLFTGNVVVAHPEFQIKCDKIEIHLAEGFGMEAVKGKPSDTPFKRATASGGMIEIKRTTVDEDGKRKTQIAIARSLDYNAATKDIILSGGPPYIQDGDRFIKTNSEDAQIIMRGNGKYEITGTSNRSQIVIPIPNSKDGKKGDGGLGGAFTSPFEGIR